MNIEAFKQTLMDSAVLLTNKEIKISGGSNIQTPWTIYIPEGDGNWIHSMHEACHFLSANNEMRAKHNLGMPSQTADFTAERYLICELKALYFGQLLYLPWARTFECESSYLRYLEYLCDANGKGFDNGDCPIVLQQEEGWRKQLNRKLSKIKIDLKQFHEYLHKTYSHHEKRLTTCLNLTTT